MDEQNEKKMIDLSIKDQDNFIKILDSLNNLQNEYEESYLNKIKKQIRQDEQEIIYPPIKNQDNLIKILDLLNDLQDKNTKDKKDKFDEIKNQIKKDLGIDQNDKDTYNYYIVDNKLRIDRLIIDEKIAKNAITDIDALIKHQSIAKISQPPIKDQKDLKKILDLCSNLQNENKEEIKNQIKQYLKIKKNDDDTYNYYIVDNKLRIDRLITNRRIAKNAITDIDALMEHSSTARLNIQLNKGEDIPCEKNCLEDLIKYVFYEEDGYINDVKFKYKKIKNFKLVFSDDALKSTKYIFYLSKQIENLKNVNYDNLKDLQKHICNKSICSHSEFRDFIRSKINDLSVKLEWKTDDFDFLSRLKPDYGIEDFGILCEVVNFGNGSVNYTKLINSYFKIGSIKDITQFIKIISNKKDFWNIVDKNIFSDTAFYGYDIFNAGDRERLGIEFEPKPTELYIVAAVLSFVFGVIPFLFLGYYFINKACQSYAFNNKFRWINEKRKRPKSQDNKSLKYENLTQKEPMPGMTSVYHLNDK